MDRSSLDAAPGTNAETATPVFNGNGAAKAIDTETSQRRESVSKLECRLLRHLLQSVGNPPIEIELWTGERISTSPDLNPTRLRICDRRTLWRLLLDPHYQFGEAYSQGFIEVDGDLADLLRLIYRAQLAGRESNDIGGLAKLLHRPRRSHTTAARENIHQHYDLGNDFYRLWLDEQLLYTCAYFPEPTESLERAQIAKMDHVCRKMWLRPGETVIEAGCGWGALALHMARTYGVRVRAFNISHEQVKYARERARAEGLAERVEFVERDWREITGRCDAFVSVGMLEHAGIENYRQFGDVIHRCLAPHGRGLIHSIGRNKPRRLDPWIERRIFPGANPPSIAQMTEIFEPHRFSVLDLENIRLHYARTLAHWHSRFERAVESVRRMFGETFVRAWRLYLLGSQVAFETGVLQLFQVTFARESLNDIPWTRAYLYDDARPIPAADSSGTAS